MGHYEQSLQPFYDQYCEIINRTNISIQKPKDLAKKIKKYHKFKDFFGSEIYTEYGDLFHETNPSYYRKQSGSVCDFMQKSENPVIIFLKPGISSPDEFRDYLGIELNDFLTEMKKDEPNIIPFCAKPDSYIVNKDSGRFNDFYFKLFSEWFRNNELINRPPLYANALESVILEPTSDGKDLLESYKQELRVNFSKISKKTVQPDKNLNPEDFVNYFAERLVRLKMLNLKQVHDTIYDMLIDCNRSEEPDKNLETVARLMFDCHQMFSVPTFYSKGSVLTVSVEDHSSILNSLTRIDQYIRDSSNLKESAKINTRRMLFSIHGFMSYQITKTKENANLIKEFPLCLHRSNSPKEQYDKYQKMQNKDETSSLRNECAEHENSYTDLQSSFVMNGSGLDRLENEREALCEVMKNVRNSYWDYILKPYERVITFCEIVSTLPIGNVSGSFIEDYTAYSIGDIYSVFIDSVPKFLKLWAEENIITKGTDAISESMLYKGVIVNVWQKGIGEYQKEEEKIKTIIY